MGDNPDIGRGAKLDGKLNPIEVKPVFTDLWCIIPCGNDLLMKDYAVGPFSNIELAYDWVASQSIADTFVIMPLRSHLGGRDGA